MVMGVSGAGKTTVGKLLAARLGCRFLEGDDYMPPVNVAKMSRGEPLNDDDRRPWLRTLAGEIAKESAAGRALVVACSALKQAYRDILASVAPEVVFVHLQGSYELIAQRLEQRAGHFMPSSLLASQFGALEAPQELCFDISPSPKDLACAILDELAKRYLIPDVGSLPDPCLRGFATQHRG